MLALCQEAAASTFLGFNLEEYAQIATIAYTVFTLVLLVIAWIGIEYNNTLRSADFAHRFKKDFFNPLNDEIYKLFASGEVVFVSETESEDGISYFKILNSAYENLYTNKQLNRKISDRILQEELVVNLLDHFEDLYVWVDKRIITIDYVKIGYGGYIKTLAEHKAIQAYILELSNSTSLDKIDYYEGFYRLYKAVK